MFAWDLYASGEKKKLVVTIQFKIQEEILWIKFAENIEIKGSDNEISTQEEEG